MVTDAMIERAAEAIWQDQWTRTHDGRPRLVPWADANPEQAEHARSEARAALTAALSAPVGDGEIEQTLAGETVCGAPVLGWLWEEDAPSVVVGGKTPRVAFHWSTPPSYVSVTRLVDATALRSLSAQLAEAERERDEWRSRAESNYGKGSDGEIYAAHSRALALRAALTAALARAEKAEADLVIAKERLNFEVGKRLASDEAMMAIAAERDALKAEKAKAWYDFCLAESKARFKACDAEPRLFVRMIRSFDVTEPHCDPLYEITEGRAVELLAERERRSCASTIAERDRLAGLIRKHWKGNCFGGIDHADAREIREALSSRLNAEGGAADA